MCSKTHVFQIFIGFTETDLYSLAVSKKRLSGPDRLYFLEVAGMTALDASTGFQNPDFLERNSNVF